MSTRPGLRQQVGHVRQGLASAWHRITGRTTWSVASTVAEPVELLCAFAAHYLDLGASEVHLFLDDPDQPGLDMLRAIDGVRLTLCTDDYWQQVAGGRPDGQVMRQIRNANRAYHDCRTDWFFFCDADEFLASERPVADLLAGVPRDVAFCRPRMAERAFPADHPQQDLFEGPLRRALPNRSAVLEAAYGDLAKMTTHGLLGHVQGKSFVRASRTDLRIRIHFPVPADKDLEQQLKQDGKLRPGPWLDDSWLIHFDGLTPLHWKLKLLRFYLDYAPQIEAGDTRVFSRRTPARSAQLNAIYDAKGDAQALARLTPLIRPDTRTLRHLAEAGGLLDLKIDPGATARRQIDPSLTYRPADFDARLYHRHGDLIRDYGLATGEAPPA